MKVLPSVVAVVGRRRRSELVAVGVLAALATVLHFGSLRFALYTQIWWWDTFVHALSGAGVAGVLYLAWPRFARDRVALFVVLPLCVCAIGTWFEVYERLFTDFWVHWETGFYMRDTLTDIVANTSGAVVFSVAYRLSGRSTDVDG